jgi:hypothetical protein
VPDSSSPSPLPRFPAASNARSASSLQVAGRSDAASAPRTKRLPVPGSACLLALLLIPC